MNELNVLLFSYLISQKSEFMVAVDIRLFFGDQILAQASKMSQYKGKIVVPDIPQKAGKCTNKQNKFRGNMPPYPLEYSDFRSSVPSYVADGNSNFQPPTPPHPGKHHHRLWATKVDANYMNTSSLFWPGYFKADVLLCFDEG